MAITQKALIDSVPTRLLVGGQWREAGGGEEVTFERAEPACFAAFASSRF